MKHDAQNPAITHPKCGTPDLGTKLNFRPTKTLRHRVIKTLDAKLAGARESRQIAPPGRPRTCNTRSRQTRDTRRIDSYRAGKGYVIARSYPHPQLESQPQRSTTTSSHQQIHNDLPGSPRKSPRLATCHRFLRGEVETHAALRLEYVYYSPFRQSLSVTNQGLVPC